MAGTKEGGLKTAIANTAKDPDFYRKIGAKGGRKSKTGGFYGKPEFAREMGSLGSKKRWAKASSDER